MWKILNTEPGRLSAAATQTLRKLGEVTDVEADRDYLLSNIEQFDAVFIGLRQTIDGEILNLAQQLKCIVTPTTGLNHIDQATASSRNVTILSLRGETEFLENVTATAELTWGLLITLVRKITSAHVDVLRGQWQRERFRGTELRNKTVGIVGYGRLGKMVASYALAFRMRVLAYDHRLDASCLPGVRQVGLEELLANSDIVSIHLPLTADTNGFIGAAQISMMKPGAVLLNTARGEIVDEDALVASLRSGRLGGAAVDVLANETSLDPSWLANSVLLQYASSAENLLITPHVGGATHESVELTNMFMIRKLAHFINERSRSPTAPGY